MNYGGYMSHTHHKPLKVVCFQDPKEASMVFSVGNQEVRVLITDMMDGTTLKRIGEQVEQAHALYEEQHRDCYEPH